MIKYIVFFLLFLLGGCDKKKCPAKEKIPTLTIYTYDAFSTESSTVPAIKKAFEASHHCKLRFVSVSSSIGALRKIELEGENTQADILLGLDSATAQIANQTGLFAPHELNDTLDLPVAYRDPNFTPFDYSYFAFIYNSNRLKHPPHSFEELANMPDNFRIAIQDPRSSTSGLGLLLWIRTLYNDDAKAYWKRLSHLILTVTKGWSESYNLFLRGEADMVLSYTTSPAYHLLKEHKENIKAAKFKEGHYLQIEVAGMLKSSKHKKLAREFLHFLHSETFAKLIPTANWTYPVIKVKLPKVFERLIQVKQPLILVPQTINQNRARYIQEWLEALEK